MTKPPDVASDEVPAGSKRIRPRSALSSLELTAGRDAVAIVSGDDADRLEWLLPERYRRMSVSPFTFYRGAAALMAADLGAMPNTGIVTQLCGDAHMSNFGVFASPERDLLFDVNDFDESSPGPFEWDVQRLAASAVLAARDASFGPSIERRVTRAAVTGYQAAMLDLAGRGELDVWYERVRFDDFFSLVTAPKMRKRIRQTETKARTRDSASATAKLTEVVDGARRFRHDPPFLIRLTDFSEAEVRAGIEGYRSTLSPDRQALLDRLTPVDAAHKVVGVGSVGTRCLVVLFEGEVQEEPVILQFKEAGPSVLERYAGPSAYGHHGERVVNGQRLMQAASDIFLGWSTGQAGRHFYWRQLRDMKWSPELGSLRPETMVLYAEACGRALARAHARGGNRAAIAAYLGTGSRFVDAVTRFGFAYADQAHHDFTALQAALRDGRLPTVDAVVPEHPFSMTQ